MRPYLCVLDSHRRDGTGTGFKQASSLSVYGLQVPIGSSKNSKSSASELTKPVGSGKSAVLKNTT